MSGCLDAAGNYGLLAKTNKQSKGIKKGFTLISVCVY